jgi:hypothetical protein
MVSVRTGEGGYTTLLVPVFFSVDSRGGDVRFRGLEVLRGDEPCIAPLARIADPQQFGVVFPALLPPDWASRPLHQTLAGIESGRAEGESTFVTMAAGLPLTRRQLIAPLVVPDTIFQADEVQRTSRATWTMNGESPSPFGYLVLFNPVQLEPAGRFIVEGDLHAGGLSVGIIRDNRWLVHGEITEPGHFIAVFATQSPEPGSLVVANFLPGRSSKNSFEIVRAGWLADDGSPE